MNKTIESAGVSLPIEEMHLTFLIHKLRNEFGFMESAKTETPKDSSGETMPLYTYPCYEWINSIDWSGADVFEYGCGFSSLFWKRKKVNLYGVDNNDAWIMHDNVILETDLTKYPSAINKIDNKFDVIVIDGSARYDCVSLSVNKVKSNGMIILDNSEWHKDTKELLDKEDFIPIHFHGFKPIHVDSETTSCYLGRQFNRKAKSIIPMGGTFREQTKDDRPIKK
jgi:hypothetical protein